MSEPHDARSNVHLASRVALNVNINCVALLLVLPATIAAQQADVIRGRISDPDRLPVAGASIVATSRIGGVSRSTRTDSSGRFAITFPASDEDYDVVIAAIGFLQRRIELRRAPGDNTFLIDVRLLRPVASLDTITTVAQRRQPQPSRTLDIGGTERGIIPGQLSGDQLGAFAAMAASIPGVQLVTNPDGTPQGFSVLALPPEQNRTTLNGMTLAAGAIPRDAPVSATVAVSPYDVARGGFSGAQFNVSTRPGSNFVSRLFSTQWDTPQLQWTDRIGESAARPYSNLSIGGLAAGPLQNDRLFYDVSFQATTRQSDLDPVFLRDAQGARAAGLALDSIARLTAILSSQGIPATTPNVPSHRSAGAASLLANLVFSPRGATGRSLVVSLLASRDSRGAIGIGPTDAPAHGGQLTSWNAALIARHTGYFASSVLTESSVAVELLNRHADPYLNLPSGLVRVTSQFDSAPEATKIVSIGGNTLLQSRQAASAVSTHNDLSWFAFDNRHQVKLTTELRRERLHQDLPVDRLGTFAFSSLDDLSAGRPSSFTRDLLPRERSGATLSGAASLGDSYRPIPSLTVQYGIRLDGQWFENRPRRNMALESELGFRNDARIAYASLSPRVGFSWSPAPSLLPGPRRVVRGGVGWFRSSLPASSGGAAMAATGLSVDQGRLQCIGPASPAPAWSAYLADPGTVPDACALGSTSTTFANLSPDVVAFSPAYAPPASLRSNLQMTTPVLRGRFTASVDFTISNNRSQPSFVDRNFVPNTRFALANEAMRPVFADPTSIVAATGTLSPRDSRLSPLFGHAAEWRSDRQSISRQASVSLAPAVTSYKASWSVSYVLSSTREQLSGFASTAGNPLSRSWGRAALDVRHQVVYSLALDLASWARWSWFGVLRSGSPFTPMIAGDVNGDGYLNDRAFVVDPSADPGTPMSQAVRQLLAGRNRQTRHCLRSQLGRLAAPASCESPWTTSAITSITFNPRRLALSQRIAITLQLVNPLAAADLLLHGSAGPRGWGQNLPVDPTLLNVTGFDPIKREFGYSVNQRFGAAAAAYSSTRSPARLTLMVRLDGARPREVQAIDLALDRGWRSDAERPSEAALRSQFAAALPNPITAILQERAALSLEPWQADSVARINVSYLGAVDSIWAPVAARFAAMPQRHDRGEVRSHYAAARRANLTLLIRVARDVTQLLRPGQVARLPATVAHMLDPQHLATLGDGTFATSYGGPLSTSGGIPSAAGAGSVGRASP